MKKFYLPAALFIFVLAACDNSPEPSSSATSTADQSAVADAAVLASEAKAKEDAQRRAAAAEEERNRHNYAMEQDGEYGYQPGLSDDDKAKGTVAKPLVMVRYRGIISGAYSVEILGDSGGLRMDCKDPCEYIRMRAFEGTATGAPQTIKNDPDSLAGGIFEDVMDGKLEVYKANHK